MHCYSKSCQVPGISRGCQNLLYPTPRDIWTRKDANEMSTHEKGGGLGRNAEENCNWNRTQKGNIEYRGQESCQWLHVVCDNGSQTFSAPYYSADTESGPCWAKLTNQKWPKNCTFLSSMLDQWERRIKQSHSNNLSERQSGARTVEFSVQTFLSWGSTDVIKVKFVFLKVLLRILER